MNILTTLAQYDYDSNYYSSYSSANSEVDPVIGILIGFFYLIFAISLYLVSSLFMGKIFKKAGLAQWPAWVPFYNNWKLMQLGGQHGALSLLLYIPFIQIAGFVFYYIASYHIGLKLQKEGVFVLVAIFLPIVWIIWLAVDSSKWDESLSSAKNLANGPLAKAAV